MSGTRDGFQMLPGDFSGAHLAAVKGAADVVANSQGHGMETEWRQRQKAIGEGLQTALLVFNGSLNAQDFVAPDVWGQQGQEWPQFELPEGIDAAEEQRRAAQLEVMEREQLRHDQNSQYNMGLEADKEAAAAKDRERHEQEAAEDAANLEIAKAMSLEEENIKAKEKLLAQRRERLGVEPAGAGEDVIKLRFQMPGGSSLIRHFNNWDAVMTLYDFVAVQLADSDPDCDTAKLELKLYPQQVLSEDETTLKSAGVTRNAMVIVTLPESEDDEDSDE